MSSGAESVLSPSVEALTRRIIGCALQVHRFLGPGLSEGLYEDAMCIELEHQKIAFERQRLVISRYRGRPLRPQRLDLLVDKSVVVEIKAVEQLHTIHRAQLLSYVRAAGLQVGLLINFNGEVLRGNIKRVHAFTGHGRYAAAAGRLGATTYKAGSIETPLTIRPSWFIFVLFVPSCDLLGG